MPTNDAVRRVLDGRELLTHPFYRRWEAGELREGELAAYGAQYAHVERQLPETLAAIVAACPPGEVRDAVAANLDDERHHPEPHVVLLDSFLDAVGATPTDATAATAALVECYAGAAAIGTGHALGVVAAYEVQAAEVARSKAAGLRAHYGLDGAGTRFWDVHAGLEDAHAAWTTDAAGAFELDEVLRGAAASRDAWWSFLDEREAAGAIA
jgi:pyrroloquinoline-quinone synthase